MGKGVGENSSFKWARVSGSLTVHFSDLLGVNLRIGLGHVRLGLVALWECSRLARFLLGLLFRLHDDCCK